jgi:tetratricopeptide (TPR) repeat protein
LIYKFLFLLFLLFSEIFAFPVSIREDWKAFPGKNLNVEFQSSEWVDVSELTFRSTIFNHELDRKVLEYTIYKSFSLSEGELESLDKDLGLFFPFISNVYEIYLNGKRIGGKGSLSEDKVVEYGVMSGLIQLLPRNLLVHGQNHIYVIVGGYSNEEIAVYGNETMVLDYYDSIKDNTREYADLILLSLYIFTGMYHFLLFIKRPQDKYNLYFALFGISLGAYLFFRTNLIFSFGWNYLFQFKLELLLLFSTASFMLLFFETFLKGHLPKLVIGYNIFLGLISILVILGNRYLANKGLLLFHLSGFVMLGYITYLMGKAIKEKNADAKSLLLGFLVLIFTIILDLIGAMHLIQNYENSNFTRYGFFTFIMGIAVVLANRFLRVHREVEEFNENLERKVEERTRELAETLGKVQQLKKQQDGDYFLTSLLIKPLMKNESRSERVKIEFYIQQKKAFEFKNKKYEIGGDISIASDIYIRGKKYIAFVNADAMGKSIQGAGGALVLGVVFRSVITRTQIKGENHYPEQWLKACFVELQNIFVSFDGTMLISVVMGLVEESSGMLYFINAEHPWVALFRDGKAQFLEDDLSLRKIGMTGMENSLRIQTFQMHPEDAVFIGSDGRDDILLNYGDEGERVINEDETLFLRNLENGGGNLEAITECIKEIGEFTDDYTLVKISYQPGESEIADLEEEEKFFHHMAVANTHIENRDVSNAVLSLELAHQIQPRNRDVLKKLVHYLFSLKQYERTLDYCKYYLDLEPSDTEYMFILASCYKLCHQIQSAIDAGESLRLREPENIKNLINLADAYRMNQNFSRAEKILGYALTIEPKNEKAQKLKQILDQGP